MSVLTSAVVTFDTTDNDKDDDTVLDVSLFTYRGILMSSKNGITGHYNNNSTNTVNLDINNAIDRSQVPAAKVQLAIHPNGNDRWNFNYHVVCGWSDDSSTREDFNGKTLTQDNSTTTDSFNMP